MWLPARPYIGEPQFDLSFAKKHLKPVILLFLPQIAISLYVTLDRTMLGALSSTNDVGIYDQALKIINILLTLVTSLGSVMLPRVSGLLSSGDYKAVNKMHEFSFLIYNLVIFPIIAGLLVVNKDFVSFFLGKDFQAANIAIAIMVFRMFFIALVWVIQLNFARKFMKDVSILPAMSKIIIASVVMYLGLFVFRTFVQFKPMLNVAVDGFVGAIIYLILIVVLRALDVRDLKEQLMKN